MARAGRRSLLGAIATLALWTTASTASAEWPPPPTLPSPPPGSTCVLLQRGTLGVVQDADVGAGNGTWAAGAYPYTWTGPSPQDHWSLYQFDLSPVPAGAQVVLAAFSTYVSWNDQSSQVRLHRITAPWEELSVTWPNFGGTASWDPAVIATFDPNGVGYKTVDVTALVQGWQSGTYPNHGLLMEEDPVKLHAYFASETGTLNQRPNLYVCYVAGGPCAGKAEGAACDDGNLCTTGETCQSGQCAGQPIACAPLDDCHEAGVCDAATGQCTAPEKQDGAPCDDGDLCTTNDMCLSGLCTGPDIVSCFDGNACTTEVCDPAVGCVSSTVSCDDGNACTVDGCAAQGGCSHDLGTCDDGDACTADSCDPATGCTISPISCDDGDPCTVDGCAAQTGCFHTATSPDGTICDDGNPATSGDTCKSGVCSGVAPVCGAGFADCDGDASNGCEANTGTDANNCAGCGVVCTAPAGFAPGCVDSACVEYPASCADGVKNGAETGVDCGGSCPSCQPVCFVDGNGPIHYWPADGAALDIIATAHGTLAGNTGYAAAKVDRGFTFDGAGDIVTFANPTNFGTNDFSVDFWVKTASTRKEGIVGRRPICDHSNMFDVRLNNGHVSVELDDGNSNYNALSTAAQINDNQLRHVAIVRKGVKLSIFVDGVLNVTKSTLGVTNIQNSGNLIAGKSTCTAVDGTNYFTGVLDELRIWGRALPAAEVFEIFSAGDAGICKTGPLTCPTGYGDCDGYDGNGCESVLNTDAENCGACGAACALPNAAAGCAASTCVVASCDEGFGNCDGAAANGCETNTQASASNCGACGVVCGAAFAGCSHGVCEIPGQCQNGVKDATEGGIDCGGPCAPCPACFAAGPPSHHWPADGTLEDIVGPADGAGPASFATGIVGQAFSVGPAITLPPPVSPGTGDFTIEAWLRTTSGGRMIVLSREPAPGVAEGGYRIWTQGGHIIFGYSQADGVGSGSVTSVRKIHDGAYHHVAAVRDGLMTRLYIDGILDTFKPTSLLTNVAVTSPLVVGTGPQAGVYGTTSFTGQIDDLTLWSRALPAAEVKVIYAAGAAGKCPTGCLSGFADCDGDNANGCETDLTSAASCGACGVTCGGATPQCDPSTLSCVQCLTSLDPVPPGLCKGLCSLGTPTCAGGEWHCAPSQLAGCIEPKEASCDGFDNDCDGMVDEGVCPSCTVPVNAVAANLYSAWDIDFDSSCNTYLTSLVSGPDFTKVVPASGQGASTYYGNANQNMGFGLVDPDPKNHRVVVAYACQNASCLATNGLTALYTCDPADPTCGCAGQANCPGFLNTPFLPTVAYPESATSVVVGGIAVGAPTGLAAGPCSSYFTGNFKPLSCDPNPATCKPCDPAHPGVTCSPASLSCCYGAAMGRLARFTLPAPGVAPTWRIDANLPGQEIIGLGAARDGSVLIGTHVSATEGRLYRYDAIGGGLTLLGTYGGTVYSITQDQQSGDIYLEVRATPRIVRLSEAGAALPLPAGVPASPTGDGVLKLGPDGKLYRLIGQVNAPSTLEVYDLAGVTLSCFGDFASCDGIYGNGCETNLKTSAASCGACGQACSYPNATGVCVAGTCGLGACAPGFGDCDGVAANGCETDLSASPASCGACGQACSVANGTASCVAGLCGVDTCDAGFADCDLMDANGCETALQMDAANCGACGASCGGAAHAAGSCQSGSCAYACDAGFGDCDGSTANGCETDVTASATNCGACGSACGPVAHGSGTCTSGACLVGACDAGFGDCDGSGANGCEAQLASNTANCGACGNACPAPAHAAATCTAGTCGVGACDAGYADCNGSLNDGCEASLSSAASCGACGNACSFANASAACVAGACAMGGCNTGFGDCDGQSANGCEASLSATTSCGACGTVCAAGELCVNGACAAPSACSVLPEVCNGVDDDCDGQIDEGLTTACASPCGAGTVQCAGGQWTACSAQKPVPETCNGVDDDCDGQIDDVFPSCGTPACGPSNGQGPVVAIAAPAAGATVTTAIDVIGTVSDTDLDSWILEYQPPGATEYLPIKTGTQPVSNGVLGKLDPTLLENGIGRLRVRALDCAGATGNTDHEVTIAGDNKVGDLRLSFTDLNIPFAGVPIRVERVYDSRRRATSGAFGYGWELHLSAGGRVSRNVPAGEGWTMTCPFLALGGQKTTVTEEQVHVVNVQLSDHEYYRFKPIVPLAGVSFAAAGACSGQVFFQQIGGKPGAQLELTGGPDFVWLNDGTGMLYTDIGGDVIDVGDVQLTTPDGRVLRIKMSGGTYYAGDLHDNGVFIGASAITHTNGQSVGIVRDGAGRVKSVTDLLGHAISYSYSASGDLAGVTDRTSATTTFHYFADHLLERYVDSQGRTPARIEYDAGGRIHRFLDGNQQGQTIEFDPVTGLGTFTSPTGAAGELTWSPSGHLSQATDAMGETTTFEYDANGNVTKATDALGNVTLSTYDASWRLASTTDPAGHVTTYTNSYDAAGHLTKVVTVDPLGRTSEVDYDLGEKESKVVHANGLVEIAARDAAGQVTQKTYGSGGATLTVTYAWDALGRLTEQSDLAGHLTHYGYDAMSRRTSASTTRTVNGVQTTDTRTFEYDAEGRQTKSTTPLGASTITQYDGAGHMSAKRDELGNWSTYERDPSGAVTRVLRAPQPGFPDGASQYSVFDAAGRRTMTIEWDGEIKQYSYDDRGRLTQEIAPDGGITTYGYDAAGRRTSVTARGGTTAFEHDPNGRITKTTDPSGAVTLTSYDAAGQRISSTDPEGHTTTYGFDLSGFETSIAHAGGTSTSTTRDMFGWVLTTTDELGHVQTMGRDALGQLTSVTDALGRTRSFTYDEQGRMLSMTDPKGHVQTWRYDADGRRTKHTLPSGLFETWQYDAAGRVTTVTDFAGQSTTRQYDAWGRLTHVGLPDGTSADTIYTAGGKRLSAQDPSGVTEWTYDAAGRPALIARPEGDVAYQYDADGRVSDVVTAAGTTHYDYDVRGLLTAIAQEGETVLVAHDAAGRETVTTLPDGTQTATEYDARGRISLVSHTGGAGTPLLAAAYGYDAAGRQTQVLETGLFGGATVVYGYDAAGQLVQETRTTGAGTDQTTYAYDLAGNRASVATAQGQIAYQYDADDRLTSATGKTYQYDANGRLIAVTGVEGSTALGYDARGRLVSVNDPTGTSAVYGYDADGERVSRAVDGVSRDYVLDRSASNAEILEERDGNGDLVASCAYGSSRLSRKEAGSSFEYYHSDAHGSVRFTTSSGVPSSSTDYDAYGQPLSPPAAGPFGYSGEQTDPETGLQYLRARYYDPSAGRFLSRDTLQVQPDRPVTYHPYAYVSNDPVNKVDPTGHAEATMGGQAAAAEVAGVLEGMGGGGAEKMAMDLLLALSMAKTAVEMDRSKKNECEADEELVFRYLYDTDWAYKSPGQRSLEQGTHPELMPLFNVRRLAAKLWLEGDKDPYVVRETRKGLYDHVAQNSGYFASPFVSTTRNWMLMATPGKDEIGTSNYVYLGAFCVPSSRIVRPLALAMDTIAEFNWEAWYCPWQTEATVLPQSQALGVKPYQIRLFGRNAAAWLP